MTANNENAPRTYYSSLMVSGLSVSTSPERYTWEEDGEVCNLAVWNFESTEDFVAHVENTEGYDGYIVAPITEVLAALEAAGCGVTVE